MSDPQGEQPMSDFPTITLPCPYGEGRFGTHDKHTPPFWPCTGIEISGRPHSHHIELLDWLQWLTDKAALGDEALYVRCPNGCDLGERDLGNYRRACDTCSGMGFVPVWPKEDSDE